MEKMKEDGEDNYKNRRDDFYDEEKIDKVGRKKQWKI